MSDQPIPVAIKREFADEVSALAALVDEGSVAMTHDPDWCGCEGTSRLTAVCVTATIHASKGTGNVMNGKLSATWGASQGSVHGAVRVGRSERLSGPSGAEAR